MKKVFVSLVVLLSLGTVPTFASGLMAPPPEPHPLMVIPFIVLLLCIALMPFIHKRHWENHYEKVSIGLGLLTAGYYVFVLHNGPRMLASLVDYAAFMALIGSLYVITGGIHIQLTGKATPAVNTGLLALGALLANVIGTTGASMLLIRPYLRINRHRAAGYHIVFFIFLVSNIGGTLTPTGPPLFLGYLKGVPFFWLLDNPQIVGAWALCVGSLLLAFYIMDSMNCREHPPALRAHEKYRFEIEGAHNSIWMFVIVALLLLQKADWLRGVEDWAGASHLGIALGWSAAKAADMLITCVIAGLMIGVAWLSHRFSSRDALQDNEFTFGPIVEVGLLFIGIFATMVPALDLLEQHAADLSLTTVHQFFWGSGILSSVLDNAPTYLNFLAAAFGLHGLSFENPAHVQAFLGNAADVRYLIAVSLGSAFFGACTYVGNGPNFMVKSIAESSGVKCPGFFGYVLKYALPILIPLFVIVSVLFLR